MVEKFDWDWEGSERIFEAMFGNSHERIVDHFKDAFLKAPTKKAREELLEMDLSSPLFGGDGTVFRGVKGRDGFKVEGMLRRLEKNHPGILDKDEPITVDGIKDPKFALYG